MNPNTRSRIIYSAAACVLALALSAGMLQSCNGGDIQIDIQFTIETLNELVMVDQDPRDDEPASRIQDLELHLEDNPNKTLVTGGTIIGADANGEAVLEGIGDENACRIYIYRDTQLSKRACSRASYEGSNYVCVEEGSASFQNCSNYLVMTPTGEAQMRGTWLLVTYLRDERVSVFTITEGQARVFPVVDGSSGDLGEPILIQAGQFLYTAPDQVLKQIEGLPARTALPQEQLPSLLQYYDLGRWLDRAFVRSVEAAAPLPDPKLLYGPPDLVVRVELGELPIRSAALSAAGEGLYVPLRITARNQGGEPAGGFKLSVFGSANDGDFLRPFIPYDGQGDFYIFFDGELPPGGEVVFEGAVAFSSDVKGEAKVYVEVDSCAGQEFPPEGCRVRESDEGNNFSDGMIVNLEQYR